MRHYHWETTFLSLFERCLKRYRSGDRRWEGYYDDPESTFLAEIGYQPREFFDFVEDYGDGGDPSPHCALLVASVRRDFFRTVQDGVLSGHQTTPDDLPGRQEECNGLAWLPRIHVKAEGKLRGELHPDIMYGCGGDRAFLSRHDLHPADFLRVTWAAAGDIQKVAAVVTSSTS